jgi:hypothetical protein
LDSPIEAQEECRDAIEGVVEDRPEPVAEPRVRHELG